MSEVNEQTQQQESTDLSTQMQNAFWGETPQPEVKNEAEVKADTPETKVENQETVKEEVIDIPKDWLKKEFDIEDPAILKAEREELKKLKETPPTREEIKFENEQSKQIYELLKEGKSKEVKKFLETQERLESVMSSEITKDNAGDIIKLNMQLKNPDLTSKEIEYKYNKQYGLPKEPVQKTDELDIEFEERLNEWKEKVQEIEMDKTIEAKMAKPELEKAKSQLVLPEIQKSGSQQSQPTQEDLDAAKKLKETFLKNAEATVNNFNGFTAQVKDKDVDYSVAYTPSKEEKTVISEKMKQFAEEGFNANAILAERWLKEDGTLNESQMAEDLSRIYMGKNADQKIATEAANQRLELYLKEKKNIKVDGKSGDFIPDGKSKEESLQEAFWGAN